MNFPGSHGYSIIKNLLALPIALICINIENMIGIDMIRISIVNMIGKDILLWYVLILRIW